MSKGEAVRRHQGGDQHVDPVGRLVDRHATGQDERVLELNLQHRVNEVLVQGVLAQLEDVIAGSPGDGQKEREEKD